MKRFITISLLAVTAWVTSLACGPWGRPNYYVFSVFNRSQASDARLAPMYNFWQQYAGENVYAWSVDNLSSVREADFDTSSNPIISYAREHNDTEMLTYLRLLVKYYNHVCESDTWSYPTRTSLDEGTQVMKDIALKAANYHGSRLYGQYALLYVRSLVQQGEAQAVINYWNTKGKTLPESIYKDMARGLYAWSLLSVGQKREALAEYADMGDMASIAWLAKDIRNLSGIKTEYEADPNSPTLIYLVQDFVNTVPDDADSKLQYYHNFKEKEIYDYYQEQVRDMRNFAEFAQQVVKSGKTTAPAMWQAAAGMIQYRLGNTDEAMKILDKAMGMKGTQRMKDNARLCRLMVSTKNADSSDKYQNYLLSELQWLQGVTKQEDRQYSTKNIYGFDGNHYLEVATNLIYDNLTPRYIKQGNTNLALALSGMFHNFSKKLDGQNDADIYFYSDFGNYLDSISADQMKEFALFTKNGGKTKLEKWLASQNTTLDNTFCADRIGTKLMREGRFSEALSYVGQVPVSYVAQQGISRYMARRDYNVERWFKRQVVDTWAAFEGKDDTADAPLRTNQKLTFCNDVLRLEKAVEQNPNDDKSLYELANLYFQASYKGDCWYLTRYASSVYDTLCYTGEKDFMAASVELLKRAKACTHDETLRQKCIYAIAFIPYGEPYMTYSWDEQYNQIVHYNTNCHYYKAMSDLANYYRMRNGKVEPFISNCDMLISFIMENRNR